VTDPRPRLAQELDLRPHPEGGWYRETWRSSTNVTPPGYDGERATATAIYFLLNPGERSEWHLVRSAEVWLWHAGGPLTLRLGGSDPAGPASASAERSGAAREPGWNATPSASTSAERSGAAREPGWNATPPASASAERSGVARDPGWNATPAAPTDLTLGVDVGRGEQPQLVVPAGVWQSAEPASDQSVLVSCVVSPGFDFADFRLLAPDR
jgi:predicted cupin superfamily sugar epimerase